MRTFLLGSFFLLALSCGSGNSCMVDSDCRLISDYCTCNCRGASKKAPEPQCATPACQTVQDICTGRQAICVSGVCATR